MPRTPSALLPLALTTLLQAQAPFPAAPPAPSPVPVLKEYPDTPAGKLLREIKEHAEVVARVEYLADMIGPRLTGSEKLRQAQGWAKAEMTRLGAVNVHEEAYDFGLAWTRGVDSARLLTHNGIRFRVDQAAWTPGTRGTVQGGLILVDARNLEELKAFKGQLKGRILLRTNPDDKRPPLDRRGGDMAAYQAEQAAMTQFLLDEGALATLSMSGRKNGLSFTSGGAGRDPKKPALPAAYAPQEPYKMLVRLLTRKEPVTLELSLGGTFSATPVQAYNVVGELRGREKPEEVVIVGGHLDSWDLGTGATDNATGSAVALEVLRAFQATGLKPRRTLRVILWSGEEQGLLGSRAYVEAHKGAMDAIQAVLVDDMGTGMVKGFTLQGREACPGAHGPGHHPPQRPGREGTLPPLHEPHGPRALRPGRGARLRRHPGARGLLPGHPPQPDGLPGPPGAGPAGAGRRGHGRHRLGTGGDGRPSAPRPPPGQAHGGSHQSPWASLS